MAFGPLVDVDWLRRNVGEPDLVVVDCRWKLFHPGAGRMLYLVQHIPGAAFVDVDEDLSAPPGEHGRHPLPDAAAFEAAAGRAGIHAGTRVVAYDEAGEGGAARLWWLLRHFGHDGAAVLDGGLRAWREAGGPLESGAAPQRDAPFRARARERDTVTAGELPGDPAEVALLDARAPERYAGEVEPIDPAPGHIPGAENAPFSELAPQGRFLPAAELRRRLDPEGRTLVAYCGSGVTACVLLLAAESAGIGGAKLYSGSWSEWSRRGLPVETGFRPPRAPR